MTSPQAPPLIIRESVDADRAAIEEIYPDAFPEEDLLPVARALLEDRSDVLSLVAVEAETPIGHVAFTKCALPEARLAPALLGPLAAAPRAQQRGVGSALVRAGLARLSADGATHVFVLGDPRYYGRFGFHAAHRVAPPYDLPALWRDAWRMLPVAPDAPEPVGRLSPPDPWNDRALWADT